jgi:hypothetical protein
MSGNFLQVIFLFVLSGVVSAQNLVKNPSFECGTDDCDCTLFPDDFARSACFWSCPNNGTSDLFSTSIPNKACYSSMPYAGIERSEITPHVGSILPRTGARFAGIFTYGLKKVLYREYLQAELSSPLIPGKYYCFEMYVALASQPKYAANNIGASFYDEFIRIRPDYGILSMTPQILEKKVIVSSDWTRISGVFKATSAAKYLTIGNFLDDEHTIAADKGGTYPNLDSYGAAYYFVDDVSVQLLPEKKFTFTGQNVVCRGDHTTISAGGGLENVSWTLDSDTTKIASNTNLLYVNPDNTTRYRVSGWNCGLFVKDTVTIRVNKRPEPTLGEDKNVCEDEVATLDPGSGYVSYSWSNGSTEQSIQVREPGTYRVYTFSTEGCSGMDEVNVYVKLKPRVDLGEDRLLCGDTILLKGGSNKFQYEWSTSLTDSTIVADRSGLYWLRKSNSCGIALDTINISRASDIFLPNVVTANADGKNDNVVIGIKHSNDIEQLNPLPHFQIWDRWGRSVFESKEYDNSWPGLQRLPEGTYYYMVSIGGCDERKSWLHIVK